jgi:LmbE family N-acetylglucosaminyl deacetylase
VSDLAAAAVGRGTIVVAGGHPDDPECGCGGLIAMAGRTGEEIAAIRHAEALRACEILGAGCEYAEAFVRYDQSAPLPLPPRAG